MAPTRLLFVLIALVAMCVRARHGSAVMLTMSDAQLLDAADRYRPPGKDRNVIEVGQTLNLNEGRG